MPSESKLDKHRSGHSIKTTCLGPVANLKTMSCVSSEYLAPSLQGILVFLTSLHPLLFATGIKLFTKMK